MGASEFWRNIYITFGRTQFDKLTDHDAPLPLAQ